jgi:hypothetical protein
VRFGISSAVNRVKARISPELVSFGENGGPARTSPGERRISRSPRWTCNSPARITSKPSTSEDNKVALAKSTVEARWTKGLSLVGTSQPESLVLRHRWSGLSPTPENSNWRESPDQSRSRDVDGWCSGLTCTVSEI